MPTFLEITQVRLKRTGNRKKEGSYVFNMPVALHISSRLVSEIGSHTSIQCIHDEQMDSVIRSVSVGV